MSPKYGEVSDLPFLGNDMASGPATMDKPLVTVDGAGKADAELGIDPEMLAVRQWPTDSDQAIDVDIDDALIEDPRDDAFSGR